jgi:uridine kinase
MNPILIGIAGASASGKTTLAHGLVHALGQERVLWLLQDSYYRELHGLTLAERALHNFDHPDAFENELLCAHLDRLLNGDVVEIPEYDYTTHLRKPLGNVVEPRDIILLDGIMVLHEPDLRARMNLKVFMDSYPKICLKRRIDRDVAYRGRTENDVIRQFNTQVLPMYQEFVEPSKAHADIVIGKDEEMETAVERVAKRISDF